MHYGFEFSNAGGIRFDKRRMLQAAATAARQGSHKAHKRRGRAADQLTRVRGLPATAIRFASADMPAAATAASLAYTPITIENLPAPPIT
jgi:hypothetical protein